MEVLLTAPAPLAPWQRRIVWITAFLVAISRLLAVSLTLWDWDEALFSMSIQEYDVNLHHPHPPGFPFYILMAKGVSFFAHPGFRDCQVVVVAGAMALFPLLFFLARELRFEFDVAFLGALLYVFFPTVWLYGGTAFSDIPAEALIFAACLLLLRGCRSKGSYFAGAVVLALATGIRPQALLFGCAPALLASWIQFRQSWRRFAGAAAIGAAVLISLYAGAALASASVSGYFDRMSALRDYVRKVDSVFSPHRAPLGEIAAELLLRPTRSGRINYVIVAFAAFGFGAALSRRRVPGPSPATLTVLIFAPFGFFAWLMLDPFSIARYATAFLPMYPLLAADGAAAAGSFLKTRSLRLASVVPYLLVLPIVGRLAFWTLPALNVVRTSASPPVAALEWAITQPGMVFAHRSLTPQATALVPRNRLVLVSSPDEVVKNFGAAQGTYVVEDSSEGKVFARPRGTIWDLTRHRYFEVTATPRANLVVFGEGWYDRESDRDESWRWMGRRSLLTLPPSSPRMRLTIRFEPVSGTPVQPTVEVTLNGTSIARMVAGAERSSHEWIVTARTDRLNDLVITTTQSITPAAGGTSADTRDLGLRVYAITWTRV